MLRKLQKSKHERKLRRKHRTTFKLRRYSTRLRLSVHRSLRHIYAQVIDDQSGKTLASASDLDKAIAAKNLKGKKEVAAAVGELLAQKCLEKDIKQVSFDRGFALFHGRVKALADSAREKGLDF